MSAALAGQLVARGVSSLPDGMLIAASAWLVVRLIGAHDSAMRFAVWFSALLAIIDVFAFQGTTVAAAHPRLPEIFVPGRWTLYLFLAWASLALAGLARVAIGLWQLRRIRRTSKPIDCSMPHEARGVRELSPSRRASIRLSDDVRVPTAIGFFRPVVLLPRWTFEELSPEELNAVLLHEFAHLRRWDDWTNLAQKIIRALLFFHPGVWWVDSRLSQEREMSCDDLVLAQAKNPRRYAECLVTMAERSFMRRPVVLAQAAVARMKHTAKRVARILDGGERRVTSIWKPALGALTMFTFLGALVARHTPQLVRFDDSAQLAQSSFEQQEFGGRVAPTMTRADQITHALARHTEHPIVTPALRRRKSARPEDSRMLARASSAPGDPNAGFRDLTGEGVGPSVPRAAAGQVINASAKENASPSFMLVVFQTSEFDGSGNVVVRTYVWRIQIPAHLRAATGLDPRST